MNRVLLSTRARCVVWKLVGSTTGKPSSPSSPSAHSCNKSIGLRTGRSSISHLSARSSRSRRLIELDLLTSRRTDIHSLPPLTPVSRELSLLGEPGADPGPPAMPVGPLPPNIALFGLPGPLLLPGRLVLPMVERALAAPVFAVVLADSIIFLKNPLLFAFGVPKPPRTPALSIGSVVQSALGVCTGWFSEAWLS